MLMRIRRKDTSGRRIAVLRNQPKLVDHPLVGLRQPAESKPESQPGAQGESNLSGSEITSRRSRESMGIGPYEDWM